MLWLKNGKLLVDGSGKPIDCDNCPCTPPAPACSCQYFPGVPLDDPNSYPESDLPSYILVDGVRIDKSGAWMYGDFSSDIWVLCGSNPWYSGSGFVWTLSDIASGLWMSGGPSLCGGYEIFAGNMEEYNSVIKHVTLPPDLDKGTYYANGISLHRVGPCTWESDRVHEVVGDFDGHEGAAYYRLTPYTIEHLIDPDGGGGTIHLATYYKQNDAGNDCSGGKFTGTWDSHGSGTLTVTE